MSLHLWSWRSLKVSSMSHTGFNSIIPALQSRFLLVDKRVVLFADWSQCENILTARNRSLKKGLQYVFTIRVSIRNFASEDNLTFLSKKDYSPIPTSIETEPLFWYSLQKGWRSRLKPFVRVIIKKGIFVSVKTYRDIQGISGGICHTLGLEFNIGHL